MNKRFTAILTLLAVTIFPNLAAAQIKIDRPVKIDPSVISVASSVTKKAKYRVTLNGFICNRPTNDDITQSDGVDDEVFVAAESRYFSANQPRPTVARVQSMVIGDTNNHPNRLRGGSGHNLFGGNGGFLAGDRYPTTTPWTRAGAPATDRLPLVVWQGELEEGVSGVYIFPTIWEWDGNTQSESETHWNNLQDLDMTFIEQPLTALIRSRSATTSFDAAAAIPRYDYRDGQFGAPGVNLGGKAGTRPIGIKEQHGNIYLLPQILPLSYDSALAAAAASPSGLGAGVFAFRYKDATDHGDYTVYVQVEKIN